ncbi:hypothetical protein [Planktomarina sp.]|uniref:hypothetical protein n=1 Tax=Planktomarina sp. TaxID=2024851 RepID=UPI0032608CA2|tara:strand:- start:203 stop:1501 length:1299 start_codon:yes stop_codon:yes gene_type:complete
MAKPMLPVLDLVDRREVISDPALRELYFGSTDTPGLIAQATEAAQKSYLDQPAILQETAGLTGLEREARDIARAGIGSYQPFLRQAEQAYGSGLGSLQASLGLGGPSARQLLGQSLRGYDPRMADQLYNPFEQQVVQQTIQDTLKAAEMQDIQQRAADIARGGESAFGSRARLTAQERQESLGRGLGDVLSRIRSGGFQTAQERALRELESQRSGARSAAQLESGFGGQLSGAQRLFGSDMASLGAAGQRLRAEDVAQLTGLGATERGIEEQRLAREFAQQQQQRMAPLQATKFIQGFAPQYQASQTIIDKDYRKPPDPYASAISTALGTYASLAPKQVAAPAPAPAPTPSSSPGYGSGMMFTGYQQPQVNFGMQQQPQQGFYNAAIPYQVPQQQGLGAYMQSFSTSPAPVAPQMPQQGIYGAPQAYRGTYA